jgi:chaperonin GroES
MRWGLSEDWPPDQDQEWWEQDEEAPNEEADYKSHRVHPHELPREETFSLRQGGKMFKFRPLSDRVLVQRIEEEEEVKKGSIIVPDTAKEKPQKGKVIAVGTGMLDEKGKRRAMALKKGDMILFGKYAGTEVEIGDQEYVIMREDDVLGIVVE